MGEGLKLTPGTPHASARVPTATPHDCVVKVLAGRGGYQSATSHGPCRCRRSRVGEEKSRTDKPVLLCAPTDQGQVPKLVSSETLRGSITQAMSARAPERRPTWAGDRGARGDLSGHRWLTGAPGERQGRQQPWPYWRWRARRHQRPLTALRRWSRWRRQRWRQLEG